MFDLCIFCQFQNSAILNLLKRNLCMKGRSHIAVNIFSAATVNNFFHIVDKIYSWRQLTLLIKGPHLLIALESQQFLHKVTFYAVIAWCAQWPDIDQRVKWIGRLAGGHRGCTHSCLSVLLLIILSLLLSASLPAFLLLHKIVISPLILEEG